jgi:DNA ligase-1
MLVAELVAASEEVAATRSRTRKVDVLARLLGRMDPDELAVGASYLAGRMPQGRVAVGYRTVAALRPPPAAAPALDLLEVDRTLERIAAATGPGSRTARNELLTSLLGAATAPEQRFLRGLLLGELRQGALAGLLAQAVAVAGGVAESDVRRALMLQADLGEVARAAIAGGAARLAAFRLTLFRPLQPMLAQTATGVGGALGTGGTARLVEWKLDGARIQVHRRDHEVRVYTRTLKDVTARHPEAVAIVAAMPVSAVVLDGEVLALREDGRPYPFQDTMRRVGSVRDLERRSAELALSPFFFDVLHVDGDDLIDRPLADRLVALRAVVGAPSRVPGEVVAGTAQAERVLAGALALGHEGVMVKDLDAPYEAGRRGGSWRKVKPTHTLDLVVLAVEWGSGRRRGTLSNIHLGARDPGTGAFVMLGKTFKGMTDDMLEWQTRRFLELETARDGHVVHVRPEQVVEVAFDGVQSSSRYPGGLALRFARVKRYRDDKPASEADTIDTVRVIAAGSAPPLR